jgi:hypothetical protein
MPTAAAYPNAPDLNADSYVVIGVATCFVRDDGDLHEVTVAEPVPSAYLEAVFKGVPTSYTHLYGTTLGMALPEGQPTVIPEAPDETQLCNNFEARILAAARTYISRPTAQELVPPGTSRSDINHSTAKKRILNLENVVTADDNVKQHEYTHKVL